jgi:hypothetical protein
MPLFPIDAAWALRNLAVHGTLPEDPRNLQMATLVPGTRRPHSDPLFCPCCVLPAACAADCRKVVATPSGVRALVACLTGHTASSGVLIAAVGAFRNLSCSGRQVPATSCTLAGVHQRRCIPHMWQSRVTSADLTPVLHIPSLSMQPNTRMPLWTWVV